MAYKFWVGGPTGDWSTGSNWSDGAVPQSGDIPIDQSGVITATNVGFVGQLIWLNQALNLTEGNMVLSVGLDLIGSSIGPTSVLITNGGSSPVQVKLHNSALQGQVFSGSGYNYLTVDDGTSAVNTGWIGAATGTGFVDLDIRPGNGNFANVGAMQVGVNGHMSLTFGLGATQQFVGNWGILQADPGGSMVLSSGGSETNGYSGTFVNFGQFKIEGGIGVIGSNLLQSNTGVVSIKGGGSALISGKTDGGTIQIEKGMLDLGDVTGFMTPEPDGPTPLYSNDFHSDIAFTGTDGSIAFGSKDIMMVFDAAKNEIGISTMWDGKQVAVATVNLADNRVYSPSQFTVSGDTMTFHSDTLA